jgi:amidase
MTACSDPRGRLRGFIRRPDAARLTELAAREHLHFTDAEADEYAAIVDEVLCDFDRLDELPARCSPQPPRRRDPGRQLSPSENPFNAFVRCCLVKGADAGPLVGMRVGVKDNIAVAGVPMTNGSRQTPYVPVADAVVVERLLEAGANIVGTLNMDDHACGVTGETSAWGPTRNPRDPTRSAGGSSSGSGAAVAAGLVEASLGVDQGGSGRIPAAFCGVVGLKPTPGVVPIHGVTHIDLSFDAVAPIARTVQEVALVVDAISGHDTRDPQSARSAPPPTRCAEQLDAGVAGLTVGVVAEARAGCVPAGIDGVDRAAEILAEAGARVVPVSVPIWHDARAIAVALWCQLAWAMAQSEGQGFGHLGEVDVDRVRADALGRRLEADELPPFAKVWLLVGRYMHEHYLSSYLAKAQNLRLEVAAQMRAALSGCDLLLTATVPDVAPRLADHPAGDRQFLDHAWISSNALQANLSCHPAVAVPSGVDSDGLPTSVQFVASELGEGAALRAAKVVESAARIPAAPQEGRSCQGPS